MKRRCKDCVWHRRATYWPISYCHHYNNDGAYGGGFTCHKTKICYERKWWKFWRIK